MTIKNLFGEGNAPAVNEAIHAGSEAVNENEEFALMRDELADIIERAHHRLHTACSLMCVFLQRYIDTEKAHAALKADIDYIPDMVCNFINEIFDLMISAKNELDIYADPGSQQLALFLHECEQKIKLIKREGSA